MQSWKSGAIELGAASPPLRTCRGGRRAAHGSLRRSMVAIGLACAAIAITTLALVACSAASSDAHDAGARSSDVEPPSCARDPAQLVRYGYRATARVAGACSAQDTRDFAAACAPDPSSTTCAKFLAKHPSCARCILGDVLAGPLRRDAFGRTEVSPGACAQALAGEVFDAALDLPADADTTFGGCGAALEDLGACVAYACGECDGGEASQTSESACREAAYRGACASRDPEAPRCDRVGASACILGTREERARAIASAVCGPSDGTADAGTD